MDLDNCYVNIRRRDRDNFVYRIISVERLFEIFEKRVNTLVKPLLWDDPFENFIQGIKGQLPSGQLVEFAQRYDFYGQCWTLVGASDAMWRIYSSDKRAVRIKVRIKTLLESLAPTAKGVVLVGKVHYLDGEEMLKWARRVIRDDEDPDVRLIGRTLLAKRKAFEHEQEVRLLCFDTADGDGKLFQYHIEPEAFIEDMVVDPRLPTNQATALIEEIKEKTHFGGDIRHSDLYATPPEMFVRLGPAYAALRRTDERVTYKDGERTARWGFTPTPVEQNQIILPIRGHWVEQSLDSSLELLRTLANEVSKKE
jgi:hypothetical protein